MRVLKALIVLSAFSMFSCVFVLAQQAGPIKSMKLLTPDVGWAATSSHLFWTTDNGSHWKDITPKTKWKEHIASVFFLDSSSGWILLVAESENSSEPILDLASTDTAGSSWTITRVKVPRLAPESTTLTGDGRIDFLDALHGWLNLSVASSSNFRLGILLASNDGGKTWTSPPDSPGVFGRIHFSSLKTGWLAGGPGDESLYVTHDGSASWQQVSLQSPPQTGRAVVPTYDEPPVFGGDGRGFLSVTFSGTEGTPSALVLYTSADEGRTWKPDRVMLSPRGSSPGQVFPSAVANSVWIASSVSGSSPALTAVGPGAVEHNPKMDVSVPDSALLQLSFADSQHGWVLSNGRLLSTADSGKTWAEVIPPSLKRLSQALEPPTPRVSASLSRSSAPAAQQASPSAGQSAHIGFHKCDAATTGQMGTWMASSPFFDAGIYIGGASRSCANSQLSPAWTTSVEAQGWGLIPLWPGPQAPCACPKKVNGQCVPFPHVFSSTPSVAETQGVAEASSAIAAASTLGLSGLVYYDMEQYSSSQCGPAVTAFVDGWVSQLHSSGFVAGVYGSAADAHTDWAKSSHVPDAVWIAKISKLPSATVWGLTPLSDTEWGTISTARIHQFLGNYSETWGKVSFTVDVDTEDGPVLNPNNGAKTPSYSFSSYDYPGSAGATFAKGVNDVWQGALINATGQTGQIVGGYYDSTGVEHGFLLDSLATWSTIDYPGQLSGEAEGINNSGQIVGVWLDTNECSHGYLYSGGAFTAIDNPNATCAAGGTALWGINDAGQITGSYCGASGCNSFLDYATKYYPITYTGAPGETNVRGINGDAMATGNVGGLNPGFSAFTSTLTPPSWTGGFSSFFDAAGLNTYGQGINNNGDVAGYYEVSNLNDFGLLFTNNVQLVSFQYPPGFDTYATGVNDFGQIVGYYHDSNQKYHVFVATP